jgi:hypothetical protein
MLGFAYLRIYFRRTEERSSSSAETASKDTTRNIGHNDAEHYNGDARCDTSKQEKEISINYTTCIVHEACKDEIVMSILYLATSLTSSAV